MSDLHLEVWRYAQVDAQSIANKLQPDLSSISRMFWLWLDT